MAALQHFAKKLVSLHNGNITSTLIFKRLLNYSSLEYNRQNDPRPHFFNKEVQSLLRTLTRVDLNRVFRKRKLGDTKLHDRQYMFMTDEQLKEAMAEAERKADKLLQIPPVVPVHKPEPKIYSKDPELQGLETCNLVFTDITFGVKDIDRLIVVRDPEGTLREADQKMRTRINQVYFPVKGKKLKPPKLFYGKEFEDLLERKEYEFLLDNACFQFDPDDSEFHRVVSIVYQHLNDNRLFEPLRSTRHFGALTFFLIWNKMIDNLLLDLLENLHGDEAIALLKLYSKIHNVKFESTDHLGEISDYINRFSNKKAALELALQAYKNEETRKQELEHGIKVAHGLS